MCNQSLHRRGCPYDVKIANTFGLINKNPTDAVTIAAFETKEPRNFIDISTSYFHAICRFIFLPVQFHIYLVHIRIVALTAK